MLPQEIIRKKRNNQTLTKEEINAFIKGEHYGKKNFKYAFFQNFNPTFMRQQLRYKEWFLLERLKELLQYLVQ